MRSIELFAGAGGLALGETEAGFRHAVIVERDQDSCCSLLANASIGGWETEHCEIQSRDVADINFKPYQNQIHLLSGGPPCQPFSIGGKHRAHADRRDMFPQAARAVREVQPEAFIFENVRGLLRKNFETYFNYILLQLTHPGVALRAGETWSNHLARLERHHTGSKDRELEYRVVFQRVNAANFGVPQKRERVFIVGFRADVDVAWSFPAETHSEEALYISQWVTGEYWDEHRVPKSRRPAKPPTRRSYSELPGMRQRWQTVRDAVSGLPDPRTVSGTRVSNHRFQPGARVYPGHTGSPLDLPAKTLKAGDHGVPGGENMLVDIDGSVRYFTVRESARLQTFPDQYEFPGSWTESMRQIGNAVPVKLASTVASSVYRALRSSGGSKL